MPLPIDLTNCRAIITGVSSGIGAGIAAALAQAGAALAGCGLEPNEHAGAAQFLALGKAANVQAVYQQADLSEPAAVRGFVAWAAEQLGGIDTIVSNAGRNVFAGAEGCNDATFQANIDLNLAAHWRLAQAAKPWLDHSGRPVVLIIASNHAFSTMPGCFPYNVAKAGLKAMVQSLAIEWGPHIRSIGIAPGFIATPLADAWFDSFPNAAAKRAQIEGIHPTGRLGTPGDIGALCAFLASPMAGFITGTTLLIDGGRSAVMQDV